MRLPNPTPVATDHRTAPRPRLIQLRAADVSGQRAELLAGLARPAAAIAPKFLYDALGSRLFAAITELPEYYPTRTEAAIFADHLPAMARSLGTQGHTLIDLGAGNCEKAARLFDALRPAAYVALDISVDFLATSLACLQREYPAIPMLGVGVDFTQSLALPDEVPRERRLFFYPGSSIGNFAPAEAAAFLRRVLHETDAEGALLIGVDLVKDKETLDAAYDDALGVTAAFNLNLLAHVNRIAGTDFDVRDWRHVAFYNEVEQRIEMHVEARRDLEVRLGSSERRFRAGDRIHTENSYKYTRDGFAALLQEAGWPRQQYWTDAMNRFGIFLARPASASY